MAVSAISLENFAKVIREVGLVVMVLEIIGQKIFQGFRNVRSHQDELETPPPQHLPFQLHRVSDIHFIDNIDWF